MTELDALQSALAGVHAATWGYGLLAARLANSDASDDSAQRLAARAHGELRGLGDELVAMLHERGTEPVAAEPAYELPFPLEEVDDLRRLAVHLEDGCAPRLAEVVAHAQGAELRAWAAQALSASAVRRVRFDAEPQAFPGLPNMEPQR